MQKLLTPFKYGSPPPPPPYPMVNETIPSPYAIISSHVKCVSFLILTGNLAWCRRNVIKQLRCLVCSYNWAAASMIHSHCGQWLRRCTPVLSPVCCWPRTLNFHWSYFSLPYNSNLLCEDNWVPWLLSASPYFVRIIEYHGYCHLVPTLWG